MKFDISRSYPVRQAANYGDSPRLEAAQGIWQSSNIVVTCCVASASNDCKPQSAYKDALQRQSCVDILKVQMSL